MDGAVFKAGDEGIGNNWRGLGGLKAPFWAELEALVLEVFEGFVQQLGAEVGEVSGDEALETDEPESVRMVYWLPVDQARELFASQLRGRRWLQGYHTTCAPCLCAR